MLMVDKGHYAFDQTYRMDNTVNPKVDYKLEF